MKETLSLTRLTGRKSALLVKMTDSALEALRITGSTAYLTLSGNQGILDFTTGGFRIDISSCELPLEVLAHGQSELLSVGTISSKCVVKANDSSFDTTKDKIMSIEEMNRNRCTKRINVNYKQSNIKSKYDDTLGKKVNSKEPQNSSMFISKENSKDCVNIRERVIHHLALKPQKFLGMIVTLTNEPLGLKKAEKNLVLRILKEVAQLQKGIYVLRDDSWSKVRDDWPHFSIDKQQKIQRNRPTLEKPDKNKTTPPGTKAYEQPLANTLHNKPRERSTTNKANQNRKNVLDNANSNNKGIGNYERKYANCEKIRYKKATKEITLNLSSYRNEQSIKKLQMDDNQIPQPSSNESIDSSDASLNSSASDSEQFLPEQHVISPGSSQEFPTTYQDLESAEELRAELKKIYPEYRQLHDYITENTDLFDRLGKDLGEAQSKEETQNIRAKIIKEYVERKSMNHDDKKKRFFDLHRRVEYLDNRIRQIENIPVDS